METSHAPYSLQIFNLELYETNLQLGLSRHFCLHSSSVMPPRWRQRVTGALLQRAVDEKGMSFSEREGVGVGDGVRGGVGDGVGAGVGVTGASSSLQRSHAAPQLPPVS